MSSAPASPKATKTATTFRMECRVAIRIDAPAKKIWSLLTNAKDFPRWNSTVKKIEGEIALGQKIAVRVSISPRIFNLKVSTFEAPKRMVWSDGFAPMFKGVRTFELTENVDGSTDFSMVEVFSGLMLPMIKGSLPDFGPPFEQYAADLKREAERGKLMPKSEKKAGTAGTKAEPWKLKTPPGTSEFEAYKDETLAPPALVVRVGKTELRYALRCIEDLHAMLIAHGDWMLLGGADEQKPAAEGTVEAWGRADDNPNGGWYGLKKGLRGRFGVYVPPVLEALGLVELEHLPKNNRVRALKKK